MKAIIFVALGSAIGGVCRYLSNLFVVKYYAGSFPMATFLVNITGCFLIGIFFALSEKNNFISPDLRLFLTTGLCGGFTTFSAFAYENILLARNGYYGLIGLYAAGSVVAGIFAVYLGIIIIRLI